MISSAQIPLVIMKEDSKIEDVQFPFKAASWYKWFPNTVLVLFNNSEASSSEWQLSITSCSKSVLFLRQASIKSSPLDAPCIVCQLCCRCGLVVSSK